MEKIVVRYQLKAYANNKAGWITGLDHPKIGRLEVSEEDRGQIVLCALEKSKAFADNMPGVLWLSMGLVAAGQAGLVLQPLQRNRRWKDFRITFVLGMWRRSIRQTLSYEAGSIGVVHVPL